MNGRKRKTGWYSLSSINPNLKTKHTHRNSSISHSSGLSVRNYSRSCSILVKMRKHQSPSSIQILTKERKERSLFFLLTDALFLRFSVRLHKSIKRDTDGRWRGRQVMSLFSFPSFLPERQLRRQQQKYTTENCLRWRKAEGDGRGETWTWLSLNSLHSMKKLLYLCKDFDEIERPTDTEER